MSPHHLSFHPEGRMSPIFPSRVGLPSQMSRTPNMESFLTSHQAVPAEGSEMLGTGHIPWAPKTEAHCVWHHWNLPNFVYRNFLPQIPALSSPTGFSPVSADHLERKVSIWWERCGPGQIAGLLSRGAHMVLCEHWMASDGASLPPSFQPPPAPPPTEEQSPRMWFPAFPEGYTWRNSGD